MRYEGLYWSDELAVSQIRNQLRIYGKGYTAPKIVDAWVVSGNEIGVPRQWAYDKGLPGYDRTVYPHRKWKSFSGQYWYNQEEVCNILDATLRKKRGALMESPTGWGKTVAGLHIASKFHTNTLILVHKEDLVPQWMRTAKEFFDIDAGMVQQDTWDYGSPATVAMIQTLDARKLSDDFLNNFGMVIVDEGHHIPCDTFSNVISQLPARYRLGVSATWRRRDDLGDIWKWHLGAIEARGVRPQLPAKYYIVPVKCAIDDRKFSRGGEINHSAMISAIGEDPNIEIRLVAEIDAALKKNRNVLVVSQRVAQVERLHSHFPEAGIYTGKFLGKTVKKADLATAATKQLILATYNKVAEGTDIPRLDTLILATPCTDPEQVYGRVAREYPGKRGVVVVDVFPVSGYNYALLNKRVKVYTRLGILRG